MSTTQMVVSEEEKTKNVHANETKPVMDDELPFGFFDIQFAQYTSELPLLSSNGDKKPNKKYILIGGDHSNDTSIYEFFFNTKTNQIKYNTVNNIYNNKYGDLKYIGLKENINGLHSYMMKNNKYILVLGHENACYIYNIYDLINDKWLIEESMMKNIFKNIMQLGDTLYKRNFEFYRSLLIKDELLIISMENHLQFYDLNDLLNPILLKTYILEAQYNYSYAQAEKPLEYGRHGMCLLSFDHDDDDDNENKVDDINTKNVSSYIVKLVLFGTYLPEYIFESFYQFDIKVVFNKNNKNNKVSIRNRIKIVSICENKISMNLDYDNDTKWKWNDHFDKGYTEIKAMSRFSCFGFECVYIGIEKKPIIIIVGGCNNWDDTFLSNSILCINLLDKEMIVYSGVCVYIVLYWFGFILFCFIVCFYKDLFVYSCVCIFFFE